MFFCKFLSFFRRYLLVCQIRLSCYESFCNFRICMLLYLIHPIAHIIITLLRCTVIAKNYSICSFVISLCYSSKSLLSSCVPYLQLYISSINRYILDLEIDSLMQMFEHAERHLPMVAICWFENVSSANRSKREVLPTSESPMRMSLIR